MKSLREEFLEILTNYQGILYKVSLIYFRNEVDRKDNFQEIVYQMWKSFPKLKNRDSIGSWIYKISINTSISKINKEQLVEYQEAVPELSGSNDTWEDLSKNEEVQLLLRAINNLNDIDKSIMLLYLEERSYEEIADITGLTKSNVGVRINRAKAVLKKNLKQLSHA